MLVPANGVFTHWKTKKKRVEIVWLKAARLSEKRGEVRLQLAMRKNPEEYVMRERGLGWGVNRRRDHGGQKHRGPDRA